MKALDPYAVIEAVMNDTVAFGERHVYQPSQFLKANYVAVLAYGRRSCKVIRREQYMSLFGNDVMGVYTQSIPIPSTVDWLCLELQGPFGEDADIVSLAIAYFALLDNHRSEHERVIEPSMVREDLLRYCLFYYLLGVDKNMDRWALIRVREHCDTRERFVYSKTLDRPRRHASLFWQAGVGLLSVWSKTNTTICACIISYLEWPIKPNTCPLWLSRVSEFLYQKNVDF